MKKVFIVLLFILLGSALIVVNNTNKDVQNSFKIVYENNKNEALPNLTNKTEITKGLYRLHNDFGVTVDYNIYNGYIIINGSFTGEFNVMFSIDTLEVGQNYTASIIKVSGTTQDGLRPLIILGSSVTDDNYILYSQNNRVVVSTGSNITFYMGYNGSYDNLIFKLQIEKGSMATPYVVPKLVPMYYDNLSMEEKQEIGLGAFGGITKIIKTINDIIKPVGDFINGLLSWF